jgi:hypothetical protein
MPPRAACLRAIAYAVGFRANSSSRVRRVFPSISSSRDGMNGRIKGSFRSSGAKSEVVVRNPFEAPSPCNTPTRALTSSAVTRMARFVCLDLIDYTDTAKSFFDGNNVSAMVTTTRRECHFIKSAPVIRASYYFLSFIRGDLKSDAGVFL